MTTELDEEAYKYSLEHRESVYGRVDIIDAFIAGAEWQKQKEPHYTKRNALFDKCVENCDPKVMKEVSDKVDEMLQKEQKPAWSKEDEEMRDRIIDILNRTFSVYSALGTSSTRPSCPTYKDEIDWLKSLRPSWKPSEEQMDSLRDTIIHTKGYSYSMYLPELYEQLKKL